MTARERVQTALRHREPDRVPFSWGFGPTPEMATILEDFLKEKGLDWQRLRRETDDKISVGPAYAGSIPPNGNPWVGIWGIQVKEQSYGGGSYEEFTGFPLAGVDNPSVLKHYPWPDPAAYDYAALPATLAAANPDGRKAVNVHGGNPFEIYCWMTGLEEALVNVLVNPAVVTTALESISGFFAERLRRTLSVVGREVDMVLLADDLGSQNGLLMSREAYRAVLFPYHCRLAGVVREGAPHASILLHSDGAVFEILPDLMEAGIDVLEAVQTDAAGMAPERLKATYGKRLGFHGGISVQQLLPRESAETVERECRRLVDIFGKGGGYIAAPSHAVQRGTPPENVQAMLQGVLGAEDFTRALQAAAIEP